MFKDLEMILQSGVEFCKITLLTSGAKLMAYENIMKVVTQYRLILTMNQKNASEKSRVLFEIFKKGFRQLN